MCRFTSLHSISLRWVTRKETAVKKSLYGEQDYAFGQVMLSQQPCNSQIYRWCMI